ncbi:hypothetical protein IFM89_025467 [Coptis chinensis]|uniref:Alliinase C-terminal domain-containing protein n=1 Tax=Coptis chinensis TaxID=261450 RepID=A0A835J0I7_9MAGN|nr:hypothetical protein IFM89_025467 [Coptis chinensis]
MEKGKRLTRWAIVKDKNVAEKMRKYIEIGTIGVSEESQLRAAKILRAASDSCQDSSEEVESFFNNGRRCMTERWERLTSVVKLNGLFSLPEYSTEICNFSGVPTPKTHPAFAWLQSKGMIEDCENFLKGHKIQGVESIVV